MNHFESIILQWHQYGIAHAKQKICKLLSKKTKKSFEFYYFECSRIMLTSHEEKYLNQCFKRLQNKEPFSKVIGLSSFYGRDFMINKHVLDPRPDSETLIHVIHQYHQKKHFQRILDLGTGSGCLIITLLLELSNTTGIGVDISKRALNIAQKNLETYQLNHRLLLKKSNWFQHIKNEQFDCIISNPPYIEKDFPLEKEVFDYDPHPALFSGQDGFHDYRIIFKKLHFHLTEKGLFFGEIGFNQKEQTIQTIKQNKYLKFIDCIQDSHLNNRVIIIQRI